jgi:toxin ParE1/3/4
MRVRWTTPAREQLVALHQYIAEENPGAAAQTVDRVWKNSQLLARHPMAGRPGRVDGTRELAIGGTPFVVAYRVGRSEIEILAVMHGARKWPDEF